MATTVNSYVNAMANWTYSLPVNGFPDIVQGPDTFGKIFNFNENTKVWFATKQLEFLSTVTYDLTNLSDVFGDTISFTHIFSIMIQCNTGRIYCFNDNFLANFSNPFPIDAGTSFITVTDNIEYASIVDATHKNLKIENPLFEDHISGTASFKIAIVGKV